MYCMNPRCSWFLKEKLKTESDNKLVCKHCGFYSYIRVGSNWYAWGFCDGKEQDMKITNKKILKKLKKYWEEIRC